MEPKFKNNDAMTELTVVMNPDSKYAYRGEYDGNSFLISKRILPLLKEIYIKFDTDGIAYLCGKPQLVERFDPDTGESVGYRVTGIEDNADTISAILAAAAKF